MSQAMTLPEFGSRAYAVAGLLALLVVGLVATPPVATSAAGTSAVAETSPALVVAVHADGSADVTLRLTRDLDNDAERVAFRTLVNDTQARQDLQTRVLSRLQRVAAAAENVTGHEMAVTDARINLSTTADNTTGIVEVTVIWSGLAAVEGDRVVVTEPFASGFEPDRNVVVRGPDSYVLASASPSPASQAANRATWDKNADLSGFEVVFAPAQEAAATATATSTATTTTADTDGEQSDTGGGTGAPGIPGFTAATAVLALVATGLVARVRGGR